MAPQDRSADEPRQPHDRFTEDLVGLDPQDPEVRQFAEHLDRVEHPASPSTVEGMLRGMGDFADSANRAGGHRRVLAVVVALLIVGPTALGLLWITLRFLAHLLAR